MTTPKTRSLSHFKSQSLGVLLITVIACLALSAFAGTTDQAFTRQVMLKAMAQNCIVPGIMDIATNADALFLASQKLLDEPNEGSLAEARAAWTQLQFAYANHDMLFFGPVESQAFWQANFYPWVRTQLLEDIVHNNQPISQDMIERAGALVKGFATTEYLLFGPRSVKPPMPPGARFAANSAESWLLGENQGQKGPRHLVHNVNEKFAARRRLYLCEVTRNLHQHLLAAVQVVQDKKFSDDFASNGQSSVNLLVNELIVGLETDLTLPLRHSLGMYPGPGQRAAPGGGVELQGDSSGTTFSEMKMSLAGLGRFYRGGGGPGINDYLQHINPGLANRLDAQFQATAAALDALDEPVQTNMLNQRAVGNALEQARKLEILLKVDVTSAMGATIMFSGYDGD